MATLNPTELDVLYLKGHPNLKEGMKKWMESHQCIVHQIRMTQDSKDNYTVLIMYSPL